MCVCGGGGGGHTCDLCEVDGEGATAVLNRMRSARVGGDG